MKILKALFAFSITQILIWVTNIQDMFLSAGLSHPHWELQANRLSAAVATVIVIIVCVSLINLNKRYSSIAAIFFVSLFVLAVLFCFLFRMETAKATTPEIIDTYMELWAISYSFMLIVSVQAIASALLRLLM